MSEHKTIPSSNEKILESAEKMLADQEKLHGEMRGDIEHVVDLAHQMSSQLNFLTRKLAISAAQSEAIARNLSLIKAAVSSGNAGKEEVHEDENKEEIMSHVAETVENVESSKPTIETDLSKTIDVVFESDNSKNEILSGTSQKSISTHKTSEPVPSSCGSQPIANTTKVIRNVSEKELKKQKKEDDLKRKLAERKVRWAKECELHAEREKFREAVKKYAGIVQTRRELTKCERSNEKKVKAFLERRQQHYYQMNNHTMAMYYSVVLENLSIGLFQDSVELYKKRNLRKDLEQHEEVWFEAIQEVVEVFEDKRTISQPSRQVYVRMALARMDTTVQNYIAAQTFLRNKKITDVSEVEMENKVQKEILRLYHTESKKELTWEYSKLYFEQRAAFYANPENDSSGFLNCFFTHLATIDDPILVFDGHAMLQMNRADFEENIDSLYTRMLLMMKC